MTPPPRVHLVMGTRPEAVKLAPLATALAAEGRFEPVVVATGQHPAMVVETLASFGLRPTLSLDWERRTGEQAELVAQVGPRLDEVLVRDASAAVVVQGDTTSALVGGLVAHWRQVPLVHLEAGLRSGDLRAPFPEEANRRLLAVVADLHLAPTRRAAAALLAERVDPERVLVVGNTVVDALLTVVGRGAPLHVPELADLARGAEAGECRLVLVTAHRRESWGSPLDRVLAAVTQMMDEHPDVRCVLPAHPNPRVRAQVDRALAHDPRVHVTGPLPYATLCRLLAISTLVLSDSGGIQEEAPTFRVPVLVLRDVTERMEAVDAGWARLVGTDPGRIVAAAKEVLDGVTERPSVGNPFGDGRAAVRSADAIAWLLGAGERPRPYAVEGSGRGVT